jgi:glutathione S-transferase
MYPARRVVISGGTHRTAGGLELRGELLVSKAVLSINSRNYGAWSLRGWLLCMFAGLDFTVEEVDSTDPATRAELLLLSPSFLVPQLRHDELVIWGTLAIREYLQESLNRSLSPDEPKSRAWCRSVSGKVH